MFGAERRVFFSHDNPGKLDPTIGSYITLPVDLGGSLTIVSWASNYPAVILLT
jgi:hypothetical protein